MTEEARQPKEKKERDREGLWRIKARV